MRPVLVLCLLLGPIVLLVQCEAPLLALEHAGSTTPGVQLAPGERYAFTELGPVVVTSDCSVRRISNWREMLPHEKDATQRRVAARNTERLQLCRRLKAEGKLGDSEETGELR